MNNSSNHSIDPYIRSLIEVFLPVPAIQHWEARIVSIIGAGVPQEDKS